MTKFIANGDRMTNKDTAENKEEVRAKAKIEKIEMDNFKSFKKATIPLSEGFTSIVGPNGSGKSNIIDAVAFAIGTNKMSNLRANVLTDLVKKDSNKDTAEVKLTLRDYGGEKHEVKREITDDGSSVFRINGTRTTNQKITDLLSAMNIMPDGHNIIMQGDITEFIQKTPQERRKVIEEISGIAEYEKKKDKSLSKLEDVAEKVREAGIIHSERQGRVEALKEEKNEAQKYQDFKKEQKKHKATILKKKLDSTKKKYEKTLKKISESKHDVKKLEKEKEELKEEKQEKQSKIDSLEEEIMEKSEAKQKG
ncbi:MAG: AAA family ATPase, partial [archaeon]